MTQEHPEQPGRVPIDELRELVEEIEQEAYDNNDTDQYPYRTGVGRGMRRAKGKLLEVIDRYE